MKYLASLAGLIGIQRIPLYDGKQCAYMTKKVILSFSYLKFIFDAIQEKKNY